MDNNHWYAMSDTALLEHVGDFVQQTRLEQNKTQQQIAESAGINRTTLVQLENGKGGNLLTLIQVLRALGQLTLLQQFEVRTQLSPLQLAKLEQKKRQRAHSIDSISPSSDW